MSLPRLPYQCLDFRFRLLALLVLLGLLAPPNSKAVWAQWMPKARVVSVSNIHFTNRGKEGIACVVGFNKGVDLAEFRAHVAVSPSIGELKIEPAYDNSFFIGGNWKGRTAYKITITAGMKDMEGMVLEKAIEQTQSSGDIPAYLGFDQQDKIYFPRKGRVPLHLESRNIKKAKITLYRLFPSNVAVALSSLSNQSGYYLSQWSEEIKAESLGVAFQLDEMVRTPVDFAGLFPEKGKGIYCLQVTPEEQLKTRGRGESRWGYYDSYGYYGYGDNEARAKIVVQTNLGVLAHWQDRELSLFVHDLESLKPVWGAKATVYSTKNQILATGKTNLAGIARFEGFKESLGAPGIVVVEHRDDYTFATLSAKDEQTAATREGGPAYNREKYEAFLYADRDLYRPGETAHVRWLVRKNYGDVVADVPLLMEILKPNGKPLFSKAVTLSALGSGGFDFATQPVYPTGRYELRLLVPGSEDSPIGTYGFQLEEFVPARMKASLSAAETRWIAGKDYRITANGQHLFGAPASQRRASAKVALSRSDGAFPQWEGYRFDNDSQTYLNAIALGDQTTDSDGNAAFALNWKPGATITFPVKGRVLADVYELGGRAVQARLEGWLFPSEICLGIRLDSAGKTNEVLVGAAAVLADGKPAALTTVTLTLEKQSWRYYTRRYYGYNQQEWSNSFEAIESRDVALREGKASARFAVIGSGSYRVRVHSPATRQYSTREFYAYGGRCQAVDSGRQELVKLSLDKEKYRAGDTARLRIESPFDGRAFIVLQGDTIRPLDPVEVRDQVAEVALKIGNEHFPGIWAEVTVVQSVAEEPLLLSPFSGFSSIRIPVENPSRQLQVTLPGQPEEVRPASENAIVVQVLDGNGKPARYAEITLAAVDEGIHLMTDYKTPDPYGWLKRSRRPDLRRAHYYDKVAYEPKKPDTGGDGGDEAEMGKRISPAENWIKTVALWSGALTADADGRVRVPLRIPEYTGQLRLVAVAATEGAVGSCDGQIFVRRPFMVQTSQPRFLLPGDTFQAHATLFNHSDGTGDARMSWETSGTLAQAAGEKQLRVAAKSEVDFSMNLGAGPNPGKGELLWSAVIQSPDGKELERLSDQLTLPVMPPAVYQRSHQFLTLKPGETRTIRADGYVDNDMTELEVTVGADALLRLQKALGYVVGYPYGCVEQTVSRLMPLYLLRHSRNLISSVLETPEALDGYVESGLERVLAMQTQDGGIAYWPGGNAPDEYGSIYALHCLTLMKNDRELEIPEENYEALRDFVRRRMRDWGRNDDAALYQRAYATYVLALGGDIEAIQQIGRFDTIPVARAARYLLAAALARSTQDGERVKKYLAEAPVKTYPGNVFDGTLNTPIRNLAVELMALQEAGLQPDAQAEKSNQLIAFLQTRHYGNTQETAFIIAALNDYLRKMSEGVDRASGVVGEPGGKRVAVAGRSVHVSKYTGRGGEFRVENTGPVDLHVGIARGGIPEKPDMAAVAKGGIWIERILHDDPGATRTLSVVQPAGQNGGPEPFPGPVAEQAGSVARMVQGRSYVVELRIRCDREMKNVIIADMLCAGLEIENPRLNPDAIPALPNAQSPLQPSYLEIRDDRLVLACDSMPGATHVFYYTVRAVTPGRFQRPSATAECMYDSTIHSHTPASWVEIRK